MYRGLSLVVGLFWIGAMSLAAEDSKKPFDDTDFVMKAASGSMFEVEMGKLAASQAQKDDIGNSDNAWSMTTARRMNN